MATQSWLEEAATSVLDVGLTIKEYGLYRDAKGVPQITLYFDAGTVADPKHDYFIFQDGERVNVPSVTTILHTAIDKSMVLLPWATKLATETIRERIFNADGSIKQLSTEEWNQLLDEAKKKHKEKLNDASNVGKIVHDALEVTIKEAIEKTDGYVRSARHTPGLPEFYKPGSDPVVELRLSLARNGYVAGIEWCRRHDVQFLNTEKKVFSRTFFFTGTADGNAHVTLCDDPKCCRGVAGTRVTSTVDWKTSNDHRIEYVIQTAMYQFAEIEETGLALTHRFINRLGKEDAKFSTWMCGPDTFEEDFNTGMDCLRLYNSKIKLDARWSAEKKAVREAVKAEKDKAKEAKAEETRLSKLAEKEAKLAIKLEAKQEAEAAKAEAKLAKQVAKPVAGPVLVQDHFKVVVCPNATMTIVREGQPDEVVPMLVQPKEINNELVREDNGVNHTSGLSVADVAVQEVSELPTVDEAEPGIAHTVQAACSARFWRVSSTTMGRIQ